MLNTPSLLPLAALLLMLLTPAARSQQKDTPMTTLSPTPAAAVAALMPHHGTVSTKPAAEWEDALAAGNGIMGALLYGDPRHDTLIADHCKLWLPAGSREILPDMGPVLPEMRRIIGASGYGAGQKFFLDTARKQGWGGHLVWTDAFHPGFFLKIEQPEPGAITDYARVEDFATGEVRAHWHTAAGDFARHMFVSKTDNVIVVTTAGPKGKVSLSAAMQPVDNALIESTIAHQVGLITCHNVYVHGKGGFDGAIRVIAQGGAQTSDGRSVSVQGADSVTLIMRILPWKTPLVDSQAWPYSPGNPDFTRAKAPTRATVQAAGPTYDLKWMSALTRDLDALPPSYDALLKPHIAAWGTLFGRVSVDLGGTAAERALSSEALLDRAQKEQRLPPALLERMYDAGRYVFLCSAGPETPPNLFGIWTGTWHPAWSGDYTTDTNLQLDTELAYSANLAECMDGYFHLWDSFIPDFQRNAHDLYGCRGILTGSRASNNGLALHWDDSWPGNLWTPGAPWIAHWYYDHYLYTGDKKFLRDRALPWMEQCALFYEDFLKGSEDASGHYTFRPSFSAENGWGDNTAQDIEIAHELLTNLIAGSQTLHVNPEGVIRWKSLLAKLPPLLINEQGQLKEWANPAQGEQNDHRHLMHLYGAFESGQFSEEADPVLFAAARVALHNRVEASKEDATHGFMHTGLAATGLGLGDLAFARVELLAKHRSIYLNMVDGHFGGPRTLCDDGNGATPEIVNRMIIQSKPGRLELLPALPTALPHGTLSGTRARGAITVNRVTWDMGAGTLSAVLTSDAAQTLVLVLPPGASVDKLTVDGAARPATLQGTRKMGCVLPLPKGRAVTVAARFHFAGSE